MDFDLQQLPTSQIRRGEAAIEALTLVDTAVGQALARNLATTDAGQALAQILVNNNTGRGLAGKLP